MHKISALAFLALAIGSFTSIAPAYSPAPAAAPTLKPPVVSQWAKRGLAFAQARCSVCHGLNADAGSPNPESPPFEAIANMPGLTKSTLRQFLRDSHNFPEAMKFTVPPAEINNLAEYMLTLRNRAYRPGI